MRRVNGAGLSVAIALSVTLVGCGSWAGQWENWGNERKQPEADAKENQPQAFVYQYVPPADSVHFSALPSQAISIAGRQWVAGYEIAQVPDAMLKPLGRAGNVFVYASSWDRAPYDRLYVKTVAAGQYIVLR